MAQTCTSLGLLDQGFRRARSIEDRYGAWFGWSSPYRRTPTARGENRLVVIGPASATPRTHGADPVHDPAPADLAGTGPVDDIARWSAS